MCFWFTVALAVVLASDLAGAGQLRTRLRIFVGDVSEPPPDPPPDTLDWSCDVTAADGNDTTIETMMVSASAGTAENPNVYCIPTGTWDWDENVAFTMQPYTVLRCADPAFASVTGGPNTCVIRDAFNSSNELLEITTPASGYVRIAGFRIERGSTTTAKTNAVFALWGSNKALRLDHFSMNTSGYSGGSQRAIRVGGYITGVADHINIFSFQPFDVWFTNYSGSDYGDGSWAAPTGFGTSDFWFIEDSVFDWNTDLGHIVDCQAGGKYVLRNNTSTKMGIITHPTGGAGRNRGCRAWEAYRNTFDRSAKGNDANDVAFVDAGAGIIWGNWALASGQAGFNIFVSMLEMRRGNQTYVQAEPSAGWGYCGGAPIASGTVNVAADGVTVTWASGDQFNTGWQPQPGMPIIITGADCTWNSKTGKTCGVASINSATQLTLSTVAANAPLTGATYWVGSPWDENAGAHGGRCLDALGNGPGDLLSGGHPNAINTVFGVPAWPRQALEPLYTFMNQWSEPDTFDFRGYSGNQSNGRLQENVHYYFETNRPGGPGAFTGAVGTGFGPIASRPATCTPGVGYLATDEGEWDSSNGSQPDGKFYICGPSPNQWRAQYGGGTDNVTGLPYPYPHPLQINMGQP